MIDTSEIQKAIYQALSAAPALAGGNVFDSVPDGNGAFPRVTIGEEQVLDDGNSCGDGWEVITTVHVWSKEPGYAQAKPLAASVAARILAIGSVTGARLVSVELESQRAMRDPDGLTSHVVSSFRFILDEA
jgi:hypothetical protein